LTAGHVDASVAAAPDGRRAALREIRGMIRKAMPEAKEEVQSGFPVGTLGGQWTAGFAGRTKGVMLCIMASGVLDEHADALGTLRTGRRCVAYRASKDRSLAELKPRAPKMLRDAAKRVG
jgi:hypothetical protein